eukprot:scaffold347_cov239-Pinguiococcus_pyrenoidosus.AAC.17
MRLPGSVDCLIATRGHGEHLRLHPECFRAPKVLRFRLRRTARSPVSLRRRWRRRKRVQHPRVGQGLRTEALARIRLRGPLDATEGRARHHKLLPDGAALGRRVSLGGPARFGGQDRLDRLGRARTPGAIVLLTRTRRRPQLRLVDAGVELRVRQPIEHGQLVAGHANANVARPDLLGPAVDGLEEALPGVAGEGLGFRLDLLPALCLRLRLGVWIRPKPNLVLLVKSLVNMILEVFVVIHVRRGHLEGLVVRASFQRLVRRVLQPLQERATARRVHPHPIAELTVFGLNATELKIPPLKIGLVALRPPFHLAEGVILLRVPLLQRGDRRLKLGRALGKLLVPFPQNLDDEESLLMALGEVWVAKGGGDVHLLQMPLQQLDVVVREVAQHVHVGPLPGRDQVHQAQMLRDAPKLGVILPPEIEEPALVAELLLLRRTPTKLCLCLNFLQPPCLGLILGSHLPEVDARRLEHAEEDPHVRSCVLQALAALQNTLAHIVCRAGGIRLGQGGNHGCLGWPRLLHWPARLWVHLLFKSQDLLLLVVKRRVAVLELLLDGQQV